MASRSRPNISTEAIVLKRVNTGEMDRVVTLLTPLQGKMTCVAKGARKLTSSQRALLEPGNHISTLLVTTPSLPIITQTRLVDDFPQNKKDLKSMKRLAAILEIVDNLFPEGVEEEQLFNQVVTTIERVNARGTTFEEIQQELGDWLTQLGYQPLEETNYDSITEYVAALAEKPLKSYTYLTVKQE